MDWTTPSRSTGHRSYRWYPEGPGKTIVFVHVNDLKLCTGPQDISWVPNALLSNHCVRVLWTFDRALM